MSLGARKPYKRQPYKAFGRNRRFYIDVKADIKQEGDGEGFKRSTRGVHDFLYKLANVGIDLTQDEYADEVVEDIAEAPPIFHDALTKRR